MARMRKDKDLKEDFVTWKTEKDIRG